MMKRTKILIVADSPVLPSGRAEIIRLLFEPVVNKYPERYELHQIGLSHQLAVTTPKWTIYPTRTVLDRRGTPHLALNDFNGETTLRDLLMTVRPDIVFALNDPGGLAPLCTNPRDRTYKLLLYVKANGVPFGLDLNGIFTQADLIVTMSAWSQRELLLSFPCLDIEKVSFLYPPADTDRFTPLSPREKRDARQDLFPPWMPRDAFVLGWVGRNRWRKQVWVLYKVLQYLRTGKYLLCSDCGRVSLFDWDPLDRCHLNEAKRVLESRPGYSYDTCAHCGSRNIQPARPLRDIFLWAHMPQDDPNAEWPLRWLEHEFGVQRDRDVYYTQGYGVSAALAPGDVPALYQLWDGLLYLSGCEGFGLPAWEAMCSSLPVIYTNYSSHAEYLGRAKAGLPVEGVFQPEARTSYWRMIADVPQTIEAVRKIYFDRELGRSLGCNGRAFAEGYRVGVQVEKWHELFQNHDPRTHV